MNNQQNGRFYTLWCNIHTGLTIGLFILIAYICRGALDGDISPGRFWHIPVMIGTFAALCMTLVNIDRRKKGLHSIKITVSAMFREMGF